MSDQVREMTFEEFRRTIIDVVGERGCRFEEHGKHGWTSVEDILDRKPGGNPGPHWCDVSPIPRGQRLLGTYDFLTGTARFYEEFTRRTKRP